MSKYCYCKNCGSKVILNTSIVLTTYPEQYGYHCDNCGKNGSIFCDEALDEEFDKEFDKITKDFANEFEKAVQQAQKQHETLLIKAKQSIKHPLWQYAVLCYETEEITVKRKSFKLFWKTFGRRIVAVKIVPLKVHPLMGFLANEKLKEKNK